MKKCLKTISLVSFFAIFALSCSDEDGAGTFAPPEGNDIFYVLNAGDWKSNNSSLTRYDNSTGAVVHDCFRLQNGRMLGNTANDIIVYGSRMYITVAGESTIEVTDLEAKSVKQIKCEGEPRYLASAGGKVFVSYFNGYVACIDTVSLEVEKLVPVGRNPERIAVSSGKLFVANSGGMDYNTAVGYDKTVSVISLSSLEELYKVDVVLNPVNVVSDGVGVYVASYGNYADIPSTLQYIDADGNVSVVEECPNMTEIALNSRILYGYFSQYDENWNQTIVWQSYNTMTGEVESPWIKEVFPPSPYKISSAGEYITVTSSDYITDGDVYIYNKEGEFLGKVPAGLNPIKMVSLK